MHGSFLYPPQSKRVLYLQIPLFSPASMNPLICPCAASRPPSSKNIACMDSVANWRQCGRHRATPALPFHAPWIPRPPLFTSPAIKQTPLPLNWKNRNLSHATGFCNVAYLFCRRRESGVRYHMAAGVQLYKTASSQGTPFHPPIRFVFRDGLQRCNKPLSVFPSVGKIVPTLPPVFPLGYIPLMAIMLSSLPGSTKYCSGNPPFKGGMGGWFSLSLFSNSILYL